MSGRRSHPRFAVLQSPQGILRVLRDIVVQTTTTEHIVALSGEPGVVGEVVSVQLRAEETHSVPARVLESQPIVLNGTVRHQLRLQHIVASVGHAAADAS